MSRMSTHGSAETHVSEMKITGHPSLLGRVADLALVLFLALLVMSCAGTTEVAETPDPSAVALAERAAALFGTLPEGVPNPENVGSPARIELGRMLYYDKRLSKNHDVACNSCHLLDAYGVDGEKLASLVAEQRRFRI